MSSAEPKAEAKQKALVVATRCTSVDQFVATFHRFCDDSTFFVSTLAERPIGLETAFSIQLEDKTPVLRGLCEVIETFSTPVNRFGRPGVRLSVKRLTTESLVVFKQLQAARLAAEAAPPPAVGRSSTRPLGSASTPPAGAPVVASPPARVPLATPPPIPRIDPRVSPAPSLPRFDERSGPTQVGAPPTVAAPAPVIGRIQPTPSSAVPTIPRVTPAPPVIAPPVIAALPRPKPTPSIIVEPELAPPVIAALPRPAPKPTPSIIVEPALAPPAAVPEVVPAAEAAPEAAPEAPPPAPPPPAAQSLLDVPEPISAADDMTNPVAVESRTPGSSFVLPANPLSNLTDQSLGGFVDCALYEETGNFFRAPGYEDSLVDIDDVVVPPPEPLAPMQAIRQVGPTAPPMTLSPYAFQPPPDRQFAPEQTPLPQLAPPAPPVRYSEPLIQHGAVPMGAPPEPPRRPSAPASRAAALDNTASLLALSSPDRKRWLVIGGVAAGTSLLFLIIVILATRGSDDAKASADKVASKAPATKADPTPPPENPPPVANVAPDVTPPTTNPPPTTTPPPTTNPPPGTKPAAATEAVPADPPDEPGGDSSSPPVVGSGPCRLTVSSTPAGSIVRIDDQAIGPSPITFDGPCRRRKVDVKHPRYALGTKFVNLTPDKPSTIQVPLARPTHSISIVTVPAGATISIAGNRAGTSPTSVKVMGFTGVTLTVEKKGFKPVVQKVYSKIDNEKLTFKLVRGK